MEPIITHEPIVVTHKGKKYDVTQFASTHPGGKKVIEKYNGQDVEKAMERVGHSQNAYSTLETFLIKD